MTVVSAKKRCTTRTCEELVDALAHINDDPDLEVIPGAYLYCESHDQWWLATLPPTSVIDVEWVPTSRTAVVRKIEEAIKERQAEK